ncbi:uncharacterized protein [Centruroides vittatus]|uniref:uncharacterized protein n=1 Tax=Centruroides vittatus TaxID=120091 RepID=UPI00350F4BFA
MFPNNSNANSSFSTSDEDEEYEHATCSIDITTFQNSSSEEIQSSVSFNLGNLDHLVNPNDVNKLMNDLKLLQPAFGSSIVSELEEDGDADVDANERDQNVSRKSLVFKESEARTTNEVKLKTSISIDKLLEEVNEVKKAVSEISSKSFSSELSFNRLFFRRESEESIGQYYNQRRDYVQEVEKDAATSSLAIDYDNPITDREYKFKQRESMPETLNNSKEIENLKSIEKYIDGLIEKFEKIESKLGKLSDPHPSSDVRDEIFLS